MRDDAGLGDGFLGVIGAEARQALLAAGRRQVMAKGARVYLEGRSATSVAILLAGRVKVATVTPAGQDLLLAIRGPGDLIGESSALDGRGRSATVTAIDDGELLIVPAERFRSIVESEPAAGLALIQILIARLRDSDRARLDLFEEAPVRVARLLVGLADRFGRPCPEGGVEIDLPLSQQELAELVSASRGAVASALRSLRDAGVVSTARRRIEVRDHAGLRACAALA